MGPFYLGGQLLQLPVWVAERLWLSMLITVGFTGLVKLARELGIGTDAVDGWSPGWPSPCGRRSRS